MKKSTIKKLLVLALLLITGIALAVLGDSYRLNKSIGIPREVRVDKHGTCKEVFNESETKDYFLPLKTALEWSSLRSAVSGNPDLTLGDCAATADSVTFKPGGSPYASDGGHYYTAGYSNRFDQVSMTALETYFLHNTASDRSNFCSDMGFTGVGSYSTGSYNNREGYVSKKGYNGNSGWNSFYLAFSIHSSLPNSYITEITCTGRNEEHARINLSGSGADGILTNLGADHYLHSTYGHDLLLYNADPDLYSGTFSDRRLSYDTSTHNRICQEYGFDNAQYASGFGKGLTKFTGGGDIYNGQLVVNNGDTGNPMWTSSFAYWDESSLSWLTFVGNSQITTHSHNVLTGTQTHTSRGSHPVGVIYAECVRAL